MKDFQMNLMVRIKNKAFWLAFVPAAVILVQTIMALFGVNLALEGKAAQIGNAIEALFAVLSILGVLNDPTTEGFSDSDNAMEYETPKGR